jgi:SAM-dependent methyltransferase
VQACVTKAEKIDKEGTIVCCDVNNLPFTDNSFDTVVDTFGLECSYDMPKSYEQIKRLTKPGGKILLLERGLGFWMQDNFLLVQKASVNLGARGQIYHHDFSLMIDQDPEVRIIKHKRKMRGMIYYYELQKL